MFLSASINDNVAIRRRGAKWKQTRQKRHEKNSLFPFLIKIHQPTVAKIGRDASVNVL